MESRIVISIQMGWLVISRENNDDSKESEPFQRLNTPEADWNTSRGAVRMTAFSAPAEFPDTSGLAQVFL